MLRMSRKALDLGDQKEHIYNTRFNDEDKVITLQYQSSNIKVTVSLV